MGLQYGFSFNESKLKVLSVNVNGDLRIGSGDVVKKKGYNYIDNTEDEILDAVKDFIQYLSFDGILESDYLADMNIYFNSYLHNTLYDSVKVPLCPSWYYDNYKLYYDA